MNLRWCIVLRQILSIRAQYGLGHQAYVNYGCRALNVDISPTSVSSPLRAEDGHLCSFCSSLDFRRLFGIKMPYYEHFRRIEIPLKRVEPNVACPFCRLIAKTLSDIPPHPEDQEYHFYTGDIGQIAVALTSDYRSAGQFLENTGGYQSSYPSAQSC
jgi:hypothetical protein